MKSLRILLPLLLASFIAIAQDEYYPDIILDDSEYTSEREKELIQLLKNDSLNLDVQFELFQLAGNKADPENLKSFTEFEEEILAMTDEKFEKAKPRKKIKMIYDQIHNTYLKKYEDKNRFCEVFNKGNYNCVSATALYAFAFEILDIPYEIREIPTHVYLVAYPRADELKVETTDPNIGYWIVSKGYKEEMVNTMAEMKIISEEELDEKSIDELFVEYYYEDEAIDLKGLLSIQYTNLCIMAMEKEKFNLSGRYAGKAYEIDHNPRTKTLFIVAFSQVFNELRYNSTYPSSVMCYFAPFIGTEISSKQFGEIFLTATYYMLEESPNYFRYEHLYNSLKECVSHDSTMNYIEFEYHRSGSNYCRSIGQYEKAFDHAWLMLEARPDNFAARQEFSFAAAQFVIPKDSPEGSVLLDSILIKFPFMLEMSLFYDMVLEIKLKSIQHYIYMHEHSSFEPIFVEFESYYDAKKGNLVDKNTVGDVYAQTAKYYLRKQRNSQAREKIRKGLEYAPLNPELQDLRRWL